jgi:hypothetical protein
MKPLVVNIKNNPTGLAYTYIGRPSKWGNPFVIGRDGSRVEVIEKYLDYIVNNEKLLKDLHELKGKNLGCYCAPQLCHGNVLIDLVENFDHE